jgi:hypothetical protein
VVTGASLIWAGFMMYLLAHVQNFADYGGRFKTGAKYAQELVSNISHSTFDKAEIPKIESTTSHHTKNDRMNVVMQAREDNLGGLISALNSVVVNTKHLVHFYLIVPDDTTAHLQ